MWMLFKFLESERRAYVCMKDVMVFVRNGLCQKWSLFTSVFDRFVALDPPAFRKHWNARLPKEKVLQLDELRVGWNYVT